MNCLLFYIDKTIGEAIDKGELLETEMSFFHALSVAVYRGNCIICGEHHSLSALASRTDNVGSVFGKVLSKYMMHRSIMEKVGVIFCICKNCAKDVPDFIAEKMQEIPIEKIITSHWDIFQKCVLLCENQNDCKYYSLLGLDYCNRQSIVEYTVDFTYLGGGGRTTAELYDNMVCREKRPVLCVVDSDIKHGNNCELGDTCKDVSDTEASFSNKEPPFQTVILQVHEIENIVPLDVLAKVYNSKPLINSYIQLLRNLAAIESGAPLLYYDLKHGCSTMSSTDDFSQYWSSLAATHGIELNEFGNVFPPIVDRKYLSKALSGVKENIENHEILVFEACLQRVVLPLEQTVFSWGCVGRPMYA